MKDVSKRLIAAVEEAIKLEMATTKIQMVKTKQRCSCGWPVVAYVEGTKFVRCLDCKEPVEILNPRLSEYEQWTQNLRTGEKP